MRTRILLFAALIGALGLGGQRATSGADKPADPRAFAPPADGRLIDEHVRTYISVQRAASAASKEPPRSAAPEAVIERIAGKSGRELSAARRLGVSADEYRWIRARIAEASGARPRSDAPLLAEIDAQVKANSGKVLRHSDDPEASGTVMPVSEAAVEHNREFLKKYQDQLDALSRRGR